MQKIISCAFNTDTACVEVKYSDGTRLSIYTPGVEDGLDTTLAMRTEIDWLIYNKPLEYARLVLSGGLEQYARESTGIHGIMD